MTKAIRYIKNKLPPYVKGPIPKLFNRARGLTTTPLTHLRAVVGAALRPLAKFVAIRRASSRVSRLVAERAAYLSVAMYAARSPASVRDSSMSGIVGCGASRNSATLAASKPGIFAIVANGAA